MTAPKLTPAEALQWLKDWRDLTNADFVRKWRGTGVNHIATAIAALEDALLQQQKPAAPVPSDEEIVAEIMGCLPAAKDWYPIRHLKNVVSMLARRIGVQGVPQ